MNESEKMIAAWRELDDESRARLRASNPEMAALLDEYEAMDRRLAALSDPVPDPGLRPAFYEALAGARRRPWWQRGPALLVRLGAASVALLLLLFIGFLFRQQLQMAAQPGLTTPIAAVGTPTPSPAGTMSIDNLPLNGPTPTPAVTVDANDPFGPFAAYAASWPEQKGMAHGALRAGVTTFLQTRGGIGALTEADLEAMVQALQEAAPVWPQGAVQRTTLYDRPALLVAALPYVDLYLEREDGVIYTRGISVPSYVTLENGSLDEVRLLDVTEDGEPELILRYSEGVGDPLFEVTVARYDPASGWWQELLRVPVTGAVTPFAVDERDRPPSLELYCAANGVFAGETLLQRSVYRWVGNEMQWLYVVRPGAESLPARVNVAEATLRAGDLELAFEQYRSLPVENMGRRGASTDWASLVKLRLLQLSALLGQEETAAGYWRTGAGAAGPLAPLWDAFGDAYMETGDAAAAWAALLDAADEVGTEASVPQPVTEVFYPGMALAAALQAQGVQALQQPADALAVWQQYGLTVGAGRTVDADKDGFVEAIVSFDHGVETTLWVLDRGDQGWYAAPLGRFGADESALQTDAVGPGGYALFNLGEVWASWNGRYVHHWVRRDADWVPSAQREYLCPLYADPSVSMGIPVLQPTPTPRADWPTLAPLELTATSTAGDMLATRYAQATPTPWDQDGTLPQPSPTPTPWDGIVGPTPPPTPWIPDGSPTPAPRPEDGLATPTPLPPPELPDGARLITMGELGMKVIGWSPDGEWLAYVRQRADAGRNPGVYLYQVADSSHCELPALPDVTADWPSALAWLADGRWALAGRAGLTVGHGCSAEAVLDGPIMLYGVASRGPYVLWVGEGGELWLLDAPASAAPRLRSLGMQVPLGSLPAHFSPGGQHLAVPQARGFFIFDPQTGEQVDEVAWDTVTTEVVQEWGDFYWLNDTTFVTGRTAAGPLLGRVGEGTEPLAPLFFARDASSRQWAQGYPLAGGADFVITLQSEAEPGTVWLYYSREEVVESLDADGAWVDPTGRWLFLFRRNEEGGVVDNTFSRRPAVPSGEETLLSPANHGWVATLWADNQGQYQAVSAGNKVAIYDAAGEAQVWTLPFTYVTTPVYWSPDSQWLAVEAGYSGRAERALLLLEVEQGR